MSDKSVAESLETGGERRSIMSRRSVLAATATGLATLTGSASATDIESAAVRGDTLTVAAVEAATDPRRRADGLETLHESRGEPTWVVEYREGDLSSLEEWAADDDGRAVLSAYTHEASRTAVVRGSPGDVGATLGARLLGDGLARREYVHMVDANPRLSLAEPITELESERDTFPTYGTLERYLRFGGDAPGSEGIAFDDVRTADMAAVRSVLNADGLSHDPTVAVVDTGVNTSEGSLFGDDLGGTRILDASKSMITGETVADDDLAAVTDRNGHGTFVAAEVAGEPSNSDHVGVLPNAGVLAIQALDEEGTGATADIARGIRYAADKGADVVVLSLGSVAWSHELDRAAWYAAGAGTLCVAAVGNDRYGSRWVASPSSSSAVIGVASTTAGLGSESVRSSYYSNVGPHPGSTDLSGGESTDASPDVAAPGHKIETTVAKPDGSLETKVLSGTSMAAPIVGAVLAASGDSDPSAARDRLKKAASPVAVAAEAEVGAGLVDADRTLSGGESAETQAEAMTDDARARDDAYRAESDSRGRALLEWF